MGVPAHAQRGADARRVDQLAQAGGGRNDGESRGSNDAKPAEKDAKGTAKKKSARTKVTINVKLPDKYRSRDKDGDGQIGLYEWPKEDLEAITQMWSDKSPGGNVHCTEAASPLVAEINGRVQVIVRKGAVQRPPETVTLEGLTEGLGAPRPAYILRLAGGTRPFSRK
jgi:hypothetical protein